MAADQHFFDRIRCTMPGIVAVLLAMVIGFAAAPSLAQTSTPPAPDSQSAGDQSGGEQSAGGQPAVTTSLTDVIKSDPTARMLLEADQLIYDYDKDKVTAAGAVDIYYRGYTVEADSVEYDQKTGKVFARGNVKVTQPDKNIIYTDQIELTDEFRDGFVQELTLVTTDETRFAAQSAERFNENITVFQQGVYTACKPCAENPDKPPFWQIKAKKIIHNQQEQAIYYEDATFELYGVPIAYVPFFSTPDPTVKQRSGFLRPNYLYDKDLGYAVEIPYYFAIAPDRDLTVSVTTYTIQGPLGAAEWRQRFEKGAIRVRGAAIYQLDPGKFDPGTNDDTDFRGVLQADGLFEINSFWKWGFQGTLQSDPMFMRTYDLTNALETRDTLFLTGQSARNWFDARIIHYQVFQDESRYNGDAQPFVHPVVDYNYIFGDSILGGRLSLDMNALSLSRSDAEFRPLYPYAAQFDTKLGCPYTFLNDLNKFAALNPTQQATVLNLARSGTCELVGAAGTTNRFISEVNWERSVTDSIGEVFKPFVSVRGDIYQYTVDDPYLSDGYTNISVMNRFMPDNNDSLVRGMATAGIEYRYPILVSNDWGYQIFEPIAQVIARPDAQDNYSVPNNDALSLVFDDTTLFQIDKFSGYDRMEGGSRANVGFRYTAQAENGMKVAGVFGQSYQLAGTNPFPDGTGLETDRSDYVAALYFSPISTLQVANRIRLDESDFANKRYDLEVAGTYGAVTSSVIFSDIAADPQQGIVEDRQEIQGLATVHINDKWSVWAGGRYEISGTPPTTVSDSHSPQWISNSFGFGYENECVTFAIGYQRQYARDLDLEPDQRITFKFALRTLTEGKFSQSLNQSTN
jgi:LPS-assembly protein